MTPDAIALSIEGRLVANPRSGDVAVIRTTTYSQRRKENRDTAFQPIALH